MNKFKLLVILFILFLCCGVLKRASAQAIPNLSSINVDDYSDQQIIQLLQQAQNAGLSDVELLQRAQNQGMSTTQLQKLQTRIRGIRSKQPGSTKSMDTIVMGGRKPVNRVDTLDTTAVKKDLFASLKPKIFGADIFKNKNNSFEPNLKLATPINYIIGPDDQLNINVYGSSVVNWKLDVSPEGNINIPGAGILNVGGKTIENATSMIKSKLAANNYAVGRGTNVVVSLGNIRSIKVIMVGQLEKPGTYTLSSLATVFNALYTAGGPTENGTLRQIEIIRNNRIIRRLDVYDFLVKGSQKDNIALQDQDIVRVPTYRTRVELTGQVKIPALFEVLPGESLQDILNYAGGFTDSAYTARIIVSQISDQQRRLTDVVEADYKNYIPLRGDKYIIQSILNRYENRVTITGAIFRPGQYQLDKGLTLSQLIEKAAGVKEDAFVERGTITRLKPDNSTELISFSVKDAINKTVTIPLQREDSVSISSIFDLRSKYKIIINGSVRKPGTFAFADSMTVENLIVKAGGFAEGASPKRIEVARRINNADPQSKSSKIANVFAVDVDSQLKLDNVNFVLMPFDIVSVYSLPGYEKQKTVKVEGEVLYPGSYTIETKNEKVSDLLARAGGPTASADIDGASLKRENIAILGIDKNKADTTEIAKERTEQLNRLKKNYNSKDTTNTNNTKQEDVQPRNNYVGIDLPGILKSPGSKIDLLLEDGDVLRVPKQQQIVRVNGEVLYPSAVVYDAGKSFKGYVLNAGGFGPDALKKGAYVVYPNGTVRGTRKFLFFNSHPEVKPGSEIYVPKKPVHVGNTAQEILGFTAGIASLAAIILEILSLSKIINRGFTIMNKVDQEKVSNNSDEISLKELILKIRDWWGYLLSRWITILVAGIIGGVIGLTYSFLKKPVYKAELSFALQDEKSGAGGLSSALGLASQFGIDLGSGDVGGEFSGDNLLELMKSRLMVEKTLLTSVPINGKMQTLAELYINFNKLHEHWEGKPGLENVRFLPDADRSKFTLTQDSILGVFHKDLIKNNLTVDKVDKKLSIISLSVSSTNELFSKYFTEVLTKVVSDFYIQTKTEKAAKNVTVLQRQTDSVRQALNAAISGVAMSADVNPNPNPSLQTLHVPSLRRQVDVQANTAILNELVKNLEIAKMSLLQETPLIQVIDRPILPLEKDRVGKLKGIVFGGFLAAFVLIFGITIRKILRNILT